MEPIVVSLALGLICLCSWLVGMRRHLAKPLSKKPVAKNLIPKADIPPLVLPPTPRPKPDFDEKQRSFSERIRAYMAKTELSSPSLLVDLQIVADNYQSMKSALPFCRMHYAVKANPSPEILSVLAKLGCDFDAASLTEIDLALAAGAKPSQICYGNTLKKEEMIFAARQRGIDRFVTDTEIDVDKISRAAPGAKVLARLAQDGQGAALPLGKKFGCSPDRAIQILLHAREVGVVPYGVSFHAGSQQQDTTAWEHAMSDAALVFRSVAKEGIHLKLLNMGGGFAIHYSGSPARRDDHIAAIKKGLQTHFGDILSDLEIMMEPGRAMVGDAGLISTEVVLVADRRASDGSTVRWVYIDCGVYTGLWEVLGDAITYPMLFPESRTGPLQRVVLAGPTCDSIDVVSTRAMVPTDLRVGDKILMLNTGAYSSCSTTPFNGFAPLHSICI